MSIMHPGEPRGPRPVRIARNSGPYAVGTFRTGSITRAANRLGICVTGCACTRCDALGYTDADADSDGGAVTRTVGGAVTCTGDLRDLLRRLRRAAVLRDAGLGHGGPARLVRDAGGAPVGGHLRRAAATPVAPKQML